MRILRTSWLDSPVGRLRLIAADGRLCGLSFPGRWTGLHRFLERRFGGITVESAPDAGEISECLRAYFDGDLARLEAVPLDPGGSPFQQRVWTALRDIAPGRTRSYSDLARAIGEPTAFRAVATANAQNPVAVVIPCHRVIHADGSLSGYGGGVERKRWLLQHERALLC
jgi:methylated-DNA-[protein]-cysteine S-methyltransferase